MIRSSFAGRFHAARRLASRQLKLRRLNTNRRRSVLQCQVAVSTAGLPRLLQHDGAPLALRLPELYATIAPT